MRLIRLEVLALALWLPVAAVAVSPVQISEFAAAGHQLVRDEDGDTPDWIELRNVSDRPVDLGGWTLSEESRRHRSWLLPSTNLPAGRFLVVFASGKDRQVPGGLLHASFKLPQAGGVLVLRSPAGDLSRIDHYPLQVAGVSYGLASRSVEEPGRQVLIGPDSQVRYFAAVHDRFGTNWRSATFDDSGWRRGTNGIGYDLRGSYAGLLRTDAGRLMAGRCVGLYLRFPFVIANAAAVSRLSFQVQYNDGYVAWLNGVETARANAPAKAGWNSVAPTIRSSDRSRIPEDVTIKDPAALLVEGTNWLTVHVFNASLQSSDLLFRASLAGLPAGSPTPPEVATTYTYLANPTPGAANARAVSFGPRVESVTRQPTGPITADQSILINARISPTHSPVAAVRLCYRVMFGSEVQVPMADDGAHGDGAAGDGVYGGIIPPQTANPGQMLRYYVVAQDGEGQESRWPLFADRRECSAYEGTVIVDPTVRTRLPVVQLFTGSAGRPGRRPGSAKAALFFDGELYDNVAIRPHGQFSRSFPKPSYNIDFPHDHHLRYDPDRARVKRIKILSNFADKSKIRNTLAYEMFAASGCIGHFAFPVRVQQNGQFASISELVENGDERWLERVGRDPQGALYKMADNLSGGGIGAEKKTRQFEPGRDLGNFALSLSEERPLETRAAFAYRQIDIPQCISYFVAMALISSDDHGHKNYYLYRDSRHSGEWALLPWDVDLSWGRNWTGEYFNDTIFVDNPLDLYRSGRHKARNRLYNLFFQYPEFRQMYLRRLRTVMDELLQPPGTPAQSLIIEKRIRFWMDQLDAPGIKPSDAQLDDAGGTAWGAPGNMRQEAQRIIADYLPGRRQFLFKSARAKLLGDAIPPSQPREVALAFGPVKWDLAPADQFVVVTNANNFAVDVSGWRVTGAGIDHRFRPGTVIPAGKSIAVAAKVVQFRNRPALSPAPAASFVQGDWKGELDRAKGPLRLLHKEGQVVAESP